MRHGQPGGGRRWPRPAYAAAAALAFLLLLGAGAAGWWWYGARSFSGAGGPPSLDRPAIAVLPFDDFGGDARQQRLADAFTEDLITELARSRELLVIARNSVEAFKGKGVDVRQVGKELGVRYALEGSLQVEPERVRITAQLIEASTGAHLWSERYDRPANDLFAVRDEVLARLVGTLTGYDGPIWAEWREAARRKPPQSLGAWDYLLLSNKPYRRHDKEGNAEARRLLEKAIELDPGLARAWGFLADTHQQDWINGWTGDRARSLALMRETAERAAALDPADPYLQLLLGTAYFTRDEVELGSAAWERALALGPNDALINRLIGVQLPIALGVERAAEGVELVERALYQLDPLHPPFQYLSLGIPLYFAGRYAEAVAALEKVPEPWLEVRVMLALSSAQAGLRTRRGGTPRRSCGSSPASRPRPGWTTTSTRRAGARRRCSSRARARPACRSAPSPSRRRSSIPGTGSRSARPSAPRRPPPKRDLIRWADRRSAHDCPVRTFGVTPSPVPGCGPALASASGPEPRTNPASLSARFHNRRPAAIDESAGEVFQATHAQERGPVGARTLAE